MLVTTLSQDRCPSAQPYRDTVYGRKNMLISISFTVNVREQSATDNNFIFTDSISRFKFQTILPFYLFCVPRVSQSQQVFWANVLPCIKRWMRHWKSKTTAPETCWCWIIYRDVYPATALDPKQNHVGHKALCTLFSNPFLFIRKEVSWEKNGLHAFFF